MTDRGRVTTWLDVTRLVSRAGRPVLTGIDRVELAWLRHLLAEGAPETRYLLRSTRGYLLFDHRGARRLDAILGGGDLPDRGDRLSRLIGKGSNPRHRLERALREVAHDRALPSGLGRLIARSAQGRFVYLNTGHSNLSWATLGALAADPRARVAVLVHDLIPITHPDLVTEGMPQRFAARMATVRATADVVICNSDVTDTDLATHWVGAPHRPPSIVAPLGVDIPPRLNGERDPRHFVMLGTIEPRKNHALMIDVWERLSADLSEDRMPDLHIIGPTGWRVEELMQRLANHPLRDKSIHLHGPLPEAAVRAHLSRAVALLFPSLAEGFGYPPIEAALAGALPICSDLPIFTKTLGDSAVYRNVNDAYPWTETIRKHVLGMDVLPVLPPPRVTTWAEHHETVARALAGIA
jgi:glycosyltransferase involved in cell wall biosynthesis